MSSTFHLAKTRTPHRADVYPRTRLYRWLDQACGKYPIIWITGPAGSGKTVLMNSYVAERGLECSWYQFGAADADPAHFLHAFNETLPQERLTRDRRTPQNATEGSPRPVTQACDCLREFFGRNGFPVMVFDNCDVLPAGSEIYEFLWQGIADLPAGSSLVFIARHGPPQSLTRQYVNHQLSVLGWDGLRLTPEESLGIAHLSGHKARDDGSVLQVHELASGWVAGFALMLREMKSRRQKRVYHANILEKSLHDYFAAEIFAREDEETCRFLMETAQLQNMTVQIAEELTGNPRARQVLMDLCHKQHFTECHEQPNPVYQYHPLFRKFLLLQANTLLHPEALVNLQRRAAALLENGGQIECAALQFIKVRDWDALLGLISRHADGMFRQGRVQTAESWLYALPDNFREMSPWALYWLGMCQLSHAEPASRTHFEQAYAAFARDGSTEGVLLACSGVIDALLAANDSKKVLGQWIATLEGLLDGRLEFPTRDCERRVVSSMFCALLYHQPARLDLGNWAARVHACLQECADDAHIVAMTRQLLRYHLWFGSPSACAVMMDTLRIIAAAPGQPPHLLIQCGLAEGFHAWFTAAYDECLKAIRKALDIALESGLYRWNFELYGLGVCASIGLAKLSDAQEWLHKMNLMLFTQPRPQAADYHYLSAWHAMTRGDLAGAHEHADIARRLYKNSGSVLYLALAEIGLAHISHERGERQKAGKYLACAQSLADEANCAHLVFLCGLVQHHLVQKQDRAHQSGVSLGRTFGVGRQHAFENTYWWQPRLVAEACAVALSCDVETSYVQGLVRRHELTLDSPPLDIEHWPWLIKIYTLGRFSLLKQGQPLWASRKAQHKPLELLKALIAYGGREVSQDLLTSVLWPDAEGDAAHNAFDITLHRLRKLIGHDKAIAMRDGRLTLDARCCWVDTWAFERLTGQTEQELRNDSGEQDNAAVARLSVKVLSLYQGHFLGKECTHTWALTLRERLRSKYLRHVTDMGHVLEKQRRWEDAVVYYQKGLEVDDLAEQFYQSLMVCYRQLGRRNEALAVYRRCRSTFSIVLGVEPSSATETIHNSLLA